MNKIQQFFIGGQRFKEEFTKQMRLLIIVTIGFTIAFTWRQTIFDAFQTIIQSIFNTNGLPSSVLTSTFITLFGLILIYITSQILKDRPERY